MSIETGVLINLNGLPAHWHLPAGRNSAYLPDSRDLWDVIWENRSNILGFAHSHPGSGTPGPSWEDITTFSGVELALGKRLFWPICSRDSLVVVTFKGPNKYDYLVEPIVEEGFIWLPKLRRLSY